jgi:hypothetical protein
VGLSCAALAMHARVSRWRLIEFELGNLALKPDEIALLTEEIRRRSDAKIVDLGKLVESLEIRA